MHKKFKNAILEIVRIAQMLVTGVTAFNDIPFLTIAAYVFDLTKLLLLSYCPLSLSLPDLLGKSSITLYILKCLSKIIP